MSAFEFTNNGIRPLQDEIAPTGVIPAADAVRMIRESASTAPAAPTPRDAPSKPSLKPRGWVQEMRARLREIEREMRRLKRLEAEAAELRRLIVAARATPRAVVRELSSARKSS